MAFDVLAVPRPALQAGEDNETGSKNNRLGRSRGAPSSRESGAGETAGCRRRAKGSHRQDWAEQPWFGCRWKRSRGAGTHCKYRASSPFNPLRGLAYFLVRSSDS